MKTTVLNETICRRHDLPPSPDSCVRCNNVHVSTIAEYHIEQAMINTAHESAAIRLDDSLIPAIADEVRLLE